MDELNPTAFIDSDHAAVREFAARHSHHADGDRDNAVSLYYAVRDGFRYDPYSIELTLRGLRASHVLATGRGWCVNKANLLTACCRAIGIPARVGYADVRNHLSTARMRERMGTDLFIWHGYTTILLDGDWLKATPAFNIELCEKFRLKPLEFDGREDSIYHAFDLDGQQHMEYVTFRGEFADVPLVAMVDDWAQTYPSLMQNLGDGDFDAEVAQETVAN